MRNGSIADQQTSMMVLDLFYSQLLSEQFCELIAKSSELTAGVGSQKGLDEERAIEGILLNPDSLFSFGEGFKVLCALSEWLAFLKLIKGFHEESAHLQ